MAFDGKPRDDDPRREKADPSTEAGKITRSIDYSDPASVVDAILNEIYCDNHFTRARVFIVVGLVLGQKKLSLEEVCTHIRFDGPDDFCAKYGDQDELPTTPSTPASLEQRRTISTDTLRAVEQPPASVRRGAAADDKSPTSVTGTLLIDIQRMKDNVAAAFAQGAASKPSPLTDESESPSSRRFPKAKP